MISNEEMKSGNILNLFCKFALPAVVGVLIAGIQELLTAFYRECNWKPWTRRNHPRISPLSGYNCSRNNYRNRLIQPDSPETWRRKNGGSPGNYE